MFKRVTVFAARRKRSATSVVRPQAEYETSLPPAINRFSCGEKTLCALDYSTLCR